MLTNADTRERPIIMSTESVVAILDGRKTQTRRALKSPKGADLSWVHAWHQDGGGNWIGWEGGDRPGLAELTRRAYPNGEGLRCPYGVPGDRLWVRETWKVGAWDEDSGCVTVDYRADGFALKEWLAVPDEAEFERLWLQSSDDCQKAGLQVDDDDQYDWEMGQAPTRWRSPIHMPRWASRLTLEVTDVRVQRVQDITEADAEAEGAPFEAGGNEELGIGHTIGFVRLWDSLNKRRGYPWASNPWVWTLTFKGVEV